MARLIAQRAGELLGQSVVIDNRAGGSGAIGVEIAARAAPDGHTWALGTTSTHAIAPATNVGAYDPLRHFTPVTLLGDAPYFVLVHPAVPAQNIAELIADTHDELAARLGPRPGERWLDLACGAGDVAFWIYIGLLTGVFECFAALLLLRRTKIMLGSPREVVAFGLGFGGVDREDEGGEPEDIPV